MKVRYSYLKQQFSKSDDLWKRLKIFVSTGDFTLGKPLLQFEKKFARLIGSKYAVGVNSGTDAIKLSLKCLNIKPNDEIITAANTFVATVGAITELGAKPVFVDCDDRFQINVKQIEKAITKKTKAILPVHWGGASPDINDIVKIAKKNNLKIIEDACMGIGAKIGNKYPGTFGEVNAFSMHPLKSLNVMGDGGMVVTDNNNLASWLRKYRNHGMINRDNIAIWGTNNRLQPLQAVVANIELKKINQIIIQRNRNAKILDDGLKNITGVKIPNRKKGYKETFALYMAQFKKRDQLKKFLIKNNIEVKIHYPKPLHLQNPSKKLGYKTKDFPIAEKQAKELLTLPVHQYLSRKQLNYMVSKIQQFYSNK